MNTPGYVVRADGEVWDVRYPISLPMGRVIPWQNGWTGEAWMPLDQNGSPLAGPTKVRTLAALTVIRNRTDRTVNLLDIMEEEPCA